MTVATGQVAGHAEKDGKPHVRIWNSSTLETMHVFGEGVFGRGVCCLAFSKTEQWVSIWEWESEKKLTEQKGSQDPVSCMEWHPTRPGHMVMCGKSAVMFWTWSEDKLTKKTGLFEKHEKPKFATICAFLIPGETSTGEETNDYVLTGDSNGNIFAWSLDDNRVKEAIEGAHDGPIFAMISVSVGNNSSSSSSSSSLILTGGSKDLTVSLFDMAHKTKVQQHRAPESYC